MPEQLRSNCNKCSIHQKKGRETVMNRKQKITAQPVFEFVAPKTAEPMRRGQDGLFGAPAFLLGGGKENYEFPTLVSLVQRALAAAQAPGFELPKLEATNCGDMVNMNVLCQLDPISFRVPRVLQFVKTGAPRQKVSDERLLAHDLANVMIEDLFTQPVYAFFEADFKTLINDKPLLPREYWEVADSLKDQLQSAQEQVIQALPQVMSDLQQRNPAASTGQLYQAALQLIGDQLSPILSTVQLWTTGFRQLLDPALKDVLVLVRAIIESNLFLALTGNLRLDSVEDSGDIKQLIPTINVSVGDVVLPVLIGAFDSGPAVMPMNTGELGPRGGHLAFIPWNLIKVLPFIISIYMHETGHVLQADIVNFMETYSSLIAETISKSTGDGSLVFAEPFVMIGTQQVPANQFWTMVFKGQLPELDADNWGMRTSGPGAFTRAFINYVGAMTEVGVGSMDKVDHVLRMGSSYTLEQSEDGKSMIKLEPHPQDGPRIGSWQAAIAELMGYPLEAQYAREYAAEESGKEATRITWEGEMPKENGAEDQSEDQSEDQTDDQAATEEPPLPTISASVADYDKVAKLIAEAFLNTKTACLNGMSLKELVCLTPEMDKQKVEPIKNLLKRGLAQLPADGRHYFFHTVGSASILALFELKKEGMSAKEARERVVAAALGMLRELLPQWLADVERLNIYNLTSADVQPAQKDS
jgi:hypothetical protein